MVWFNTLVNSAGGTILSGPTTVALGPPAQVAAGVMKQLATSVSADPSLTNQQEDDNRLAFEKGVAAFEINYPFVYPSAQMNAPKIAAQMGYTRYPAIASGMPSRVSIGGLNLGVSTYSQHPADAFEAAVCLRNAAHQKVGAIKGGLPPTLSALYDDPSLAKPYPFHQLIKEQLASASVRPQTPLYSDVSLAIQKTLSPPSGLNTAGIVSALGSELKKALSSSELI
jgi:multiple sugar transport system substrate-binding protein